MKEAIGANRNVTDAKECKELERLRFFARHNEASALGNARRQAQREEREKWQKVIAERDAALAERDVALADIVAVIADLEAETARLRTRVDESK